MDLYELLGVARAATKKEIRAAYRKRSKTAHPDTGGSAEKFNDLKRAYDILMDDGRRAKYDATGDVSEQTPDNSMAEAINIVSSALDEALGKCERSGRAATEHDVIGLMKDVIQSRKQPLTQSLSTVERALSTNRKIIGRFRVVKGENLLDAMVKARIADLEQHKSRIAIDIGKIDRAMNMLADYTFLREPGVDAGYRPETAADRISRMLGGVQFIS